MPLLWSVYLDFTPFRCKCFGLTDGYTNDPKNGASYIVVVKGHNTLDMNGLNKHFADIKGSGFVGAELIEIGLAYYKSCEKIGQN